MPTVQPPPLNVGLLRADGNVSDLWSRFFIRSQAAITTGSAPSDARYWVSQTHGDLTAEVSLAAIGSGYLRNTVALGIATPSTSATIPSSDLTGDLPALDGSALTGLSSSALTGALPAISGAALTSLTATALVYVVTSVTFAMTPYVILATDSTLLVDCTGGNVALTLPTPTAGRILVVKKTDVSVNTVQLTGTVDTAVNPTLGTQFQSRVIQADGVSWNILSGYL